MTLNQLLVQKNWMALTAAIIQATHEGKTVVVERHDGLIHYISERSLFMCSPASGTMEIGEISLHIDQIANISIQAPTPIASISHNLRQYLGDLVDNPVVLAQVIQTLSETISPEQLATACRHVLLSYAEELVNLSMQHNGYADVLGANEEDLRQLIVNYENN